MNCEQARAAAIDKKKRRRAERRYERRCRWILGGHVYRTHPPTGGWGVWECICCGYVPTSSPMDWRVVEEESPAPSVMTDPPQE